MTAAHLPAGASWGITPQAQRERMRAEHDRLLVDLWRKVSAYLAEPSEPQHGARMLGEAAELCRRIRELRAVLYN